jgi:F-type H+-transporting ATPase subunit gamma
MAKARALDKRRKAIKNIHKITRTMELIATARFKKAMDRAQAATAYTKRVTRLVSDLAQAGLEVRHPLLESRDTTTNATLLILTANRGLCGGYNSAVARVGFERLAELNKLAERVRLEIAGKRGINAAKYRGITPEATYTNFEDRPAFDEVDAIATRYLEEFATGKLDRLDVAYTKFFSSSKQAPVVETLLPLGALEGSGDPDATTGPRSEGGGSPYEFLPSAESILEEVVPMSFKIKLFKCFLDAAVSEQIARMVAMKSATDNADKMYKELSSSYNRARQGQITSELLEIMGGAEALKK